MRQTSMAPGKIRIRLNGKEGRPERDGGQTKRIGSGIGEKGPQQQLTGPAPRRSVEE